MARAVGYYSFRDGPDVGERTWETSDGRELTPSEARDYAKEAAATHGFTYQIVLSTERGLDLGSDGYRQFLDAEGFKDYMLIQHHNTDNAHAHIIAWRSQVISKKEIGAFTERYYEVADQVKEQQQERGQLDQAEARIPGPPVVDMLDIVTQPTATGSDLESVAQDLRGPAARPEDEELLAFLDRLGTTPDVDYSDLLEAVEYRGYSHQDMATTAEQLREPPEISAEDEAFLRFLETLDRDHDQAEQEREPTPEQSQERELDREPERKRDRGLEIDM